MRLIPLQMNVPCLTKYDYKGMKNVQFLAAKINLPSCINFIDIN